MARRKVIADSEDEDEDEVEDSVVTDGAHRPEPEPLSPHHRPSSPAEVTESHHLTSDVTDPSFFARIYDNQQTLAVQQSNLIEHIVQQTQRASASSGDVSFPAKTRGRRVMASSGTDVTSPMILSRPHIHTRIFSDGASEITTPRKSLGQEWDVPSSPEDAPSRGPRSRQITYSKRKGETQKSVLSPSDNTLSAEETAQGAPPGDTGVGDQMEPSAMSMARRKSAQYDSAMPDTPRFYVAQSNLTTMQRLEYQKVNTSMNCHGGLPGSLSHHRSSGATTIAYSTPSGYSPAPPLPWDEPSVVGMQPGSPSRNAAIDITSSPDVFASGYEFSKAKAKSPTVGPGMETPVPNESCETPARPQGRTPGSKGKKRAAQDSEEDELNQDHAWDAEGADMPKELYKPRPTKRRSTVAASYSGEEIQASTVEARIENPVVETQVAPEAPMPDLLGIVQLGPQPESLPKKRGRKKKQPVAEDPPTVTETINESLYQDQSAVPISTVAEAEPTVEKPKKKRGRPRKLEPSKAKEETWTEPLQEPPVADQLPPETDQTPNDEGLDETAVLPEIRHNGAQKTGGKRKKPTEEMEGSADSKASRLPLKEMDNNLTSTSPSKTLATGASSPAKADVETENEKEKGTPKTLSKETTPRLSATPQPKVPYRVGLSRRSRIAPLLKSIKK